MKILLAVVIFFSLSLGCSASHRNPVAEIRLSLSESSQVRLFAESRSFAQANGLSVKFSQNLPREGRFVRQMMLEDPKGTIIVLQNFASPDVIVVHFFSPDNDTTWSELKDRWEKDVKESILR